MIIIVIRSIFLCAFFTLTIVFIVFAHTLANQLEENSVNTDMIFETQ